MCGAFCGECKQAFVAISQNIFTISFLLLGWRFKVQVQGVIRKKRECEGLLILI